MQPVDPVKLKVKLPSKHYQLQLNLLPTNLTHLTFGPNFNLPVDNLLPQTLTHLTFESYNSLGCFNQPVDHLPPSLTHLTFGSQFNQPVNNLPSTLIHLTFGKSFQQIINYLPPSITHLKFFEFAHPFSTLPPNTSHLTVDVCKQTIQFLPPSIKYLELNYPCKVSAIPPQLTTLNHSNYSYNTTILPSTVEELRVYEFENTEQFPPNLKHLAINRLETTMPKLPLLLLSLEVYDIRLAEDEDKPINLHLPPNLQKLMLCGLLHIQLPLPATLVDVYLHVDGRIALIKQVFSLPNLRYMTIRFTDQLDPNTFPHLSLPPKLLTINLLGSYNYKSFPELIPRIDFASSSSLVSMKILNTSKQLLQLSSTQFPPSLTSLALENITFTGELPQLQHLRLRNVSVLPQLPDALIYLQCAGECQSPSFFPTTLQSLTMKAPDSLPLLPPYLKELRLHGNLIPPIKYNSNIPPLQQSTHWRRTNTFRKMPILPHSLRLLHAPDYCLSPEDVIPPFIETVHIAYSKDLPEFPLSLESLTID